MSLMFNSSSDFEYDWHHEVGQYWAVLGNYYWTGCLWLWCQLRISFHRVSRSVLFLAFPAIMVSGSSGTSDVKGLGVIWWAIRKSRCAPTQNTRRWNDDVDWRRLRLGIDMMHITDQTCPKSLVIDEYEYGEDDPFFFKRVNRFTHSHSGFGWTGNCLSWQASHVHILEQTAMNPPPDPGSSTDSSSTSGTPSQEEVTHGSIQPDVQIQLPSGPGFFQIANQITAFAGASKRRNPSSGSSGPAASARDTKLRRRGDASRSTLETRVETQAPRKEKDELVDTNIVEFLRKGILVIYLCRTSRAHALYRNRWPFIWNLYLSVFYLIHSPCASLSPPHLISCLDLKRHLVNSVFSCKSLNLIPGAVYGLWSQLMLRIQWI